MYQIRAPFRLTLGLLVVLAVTGAVSLLAAPSATATGGCTNYNAVGFNIGVCIDDRRSHFVSAYSDAYVNSVPSGNWSCQLYIEQWADGVGKLFQDGWYSCAASSIPKVASHYTTVAPGDRLFIHTSVWILFNGGFVRVGDSPPFWFCGSGAC